VRPARILMAAALLAACGDDPATERSAQLLRAQSCSEAEELIVEAAIAAMEARLDQELEWTLQYGGCGWASDDEASPGGPPPPPAPPPSAPSEDGASEHSTTNNQIAGVDEADFVKNDAGYLYVVSGSHLRVIDAWPAAEAHELSRLAIEGTPRSLFVQADRAVVYSSLNVVDGEESWGRASCSYGYGCDFTGDGRPTKITVVDLADKARPVVLREIRSTGSFLAARRIGDAVHTVLTQPPLQVPGLSYWPEEDLCDLADANVHIHLAFDKLRRKNRRLIRDAGRWLPSVADRIVTAAGEQTEVHRSCDLYGAAVGEALTTVLSFDVTALERLATATILSRPGPVYSSAEALYMAVPDPTSQPYAYAEADKSESDVHKFALDDATARYVGSGRIKGRVLNQFAMDEHDGFLRVATTSGHVPDPDVHSTVTVLAEGLRELTAVGAIDHLAPTEDIRSVRFAGDRGFIVTFKKTDPLFVLDLAEPAAPKVLAELKIPGFSTYMHMMDADHLLTIGYDAADQGDFAFFTGVLLQIFDVSDPTAPVLAHKHVIGTRGSSSAALTNHLAFNYFAPKNLLSIPMTVCEGGNSDGGSGDQMTFSGLQIYDVTAEAGFALRGEVPHPAGQNITCYNWWTDASSQVERSVIMDDFVFSISQSLIKVNALGNLATDLGALPIGD
jgi:hypothetical protein